MDGLPTPPNEEHARPHGQKRPHTTSKPVKSVHRSTKRTNTHPHPSSPARESHSQHSERHKRVWKACERCRMKKTKCDGEFPCKRCKDDGLICTAGTRKKTEYKQLPPGYAEVLENSQFVLIATVQKLYSMVRSGEAWALGEPELNDRGQPIIHNVAAKLGCLRPNSDLDLPIQSVFPEDEAGMAELARQLREQQHKDAPASLRNGGLDAGDLSPASDDAEHSSEDLDFDTDYRKAAFGGGGGGSASSALSMSPASLSYGGDFDISPHSPATTTTFATHHSNSSFQWSSAPQQPPQRQQQQPAMAAAARPPSSPMDFATHPLWMSQGLALESGVLLSAGLLGGGGYDMKQQPQVFSSSCRNPEIMMGMVADPTIFPGYEDDTLRPAF